MIASVAAILVLASVCMQGRGGTAERLVRRLTLLSLTGDYEHKSPARLQYEEFLRQLTSKMEAEKVRLVQE